MKFKEIIEELKRQEDNKKKIEEETKYEQTRIDTDTKI